MSFDDGIMDIATCEHIGQRVPHEFADAQLPLRATRRRITMLFLPCLCTKTFKRHGRRFAAISFRLPGKSPGMTVEIGGEKIRPHA
jgi:hypothetical protein